MIDESVDSCAIIGNSPNILQRELGSSIDSHNKIIRCNLGLVKGFEKFVGSRTDIRLINCHVQRTIQNTSQRINPEKFESLKYNKIQDIILPNEILILKDARENSFRHEIPMEHDFIRNSNMHNKVYSYSHHIFEKYKISIHYSAGAFAVAMALDLFPNAKIDLYGFSFAGQKDPEASTHYFEKINGSEYNHHYDKEKEFFLRHSDRVSII